MSLNLKEKLFRSHKKKNLLFLWVNSSIDVYQIQTEKRNLKYLFLIHFKNITC
jgi:hypothetical protein